MNRTRLMGIGLAALLLWTATAVAGEVEVVKTRFEFRNGSWQVSTTLRHADSGWSHYADAFRVVTEQGEELGVRTLFHPHEHEQPFTRSLNNLVIPPGVNIVYVEAHDKVHGWSKQRIRVDLTQSSGERFEVRR